MNNYINTTTGVSRGPIRIQRNGPWLYSREKNFQISNYNDSTTETRTVTCLEFFKYTGEKTETTDGYGVETATNNAVINSKQDVYLQVPAMDTGFHKEKIDGKEILVPNAGDYTIPNIQWVRIYCNQYLSGDTPIDVNNLVTLKQLNDAITYYDNTTVTPISNKLDETREICDNLSRWKTDDIWILDGGNPAHRLRF